MGMATSSPLAKCKRSQWQYCKALYEQGQLPTHPPGPAPPSSAAGRAPPTGWRSTGSCQSRGSQSGCGHHPASGPAPRSTSVWKDASSLQHSKSSGDVLQCFTITFLWSWRRRRKKERKKKHTHLEWLGNYSFSGPRYASYCRCHEMQSLTKFVTMQQNKKQISALKVKLPTCFHRIERDV